MAVKRLFFLNRALIIFTRAHCKVGSVVSCAKTAEPIEMQSGMLTRFGPGNVYYMRM